MELTELKAKIVSAFKGSDKELQDILEIIEQDESVFPFNEYEHLICRLIDSGGLSYKNYIEIRSEYISENPNLWIFEISAPRSFGEKFAQTYVMGMSPKIKKASKKHDPESAGQYDLWLDGIRIEVKASRVVEAGSTEPLYKKALARDTKKPFLMNFQQLKPQYCDVFIWVAVFRDVIVTWVIGSDDILKHDLYSIGQHRGNKGNEGQLHIKHDNIDRLDAYEFKGGDFAALVRKAARKNPEAR